MRRTARRARGRDARDAMAEADFDRDEEAEEARLKRAREEPEPQTAYGKIEADHHEKILEGNREVAVLKAAWESAKDHTSRAKKLWETTDEAFHKFVQDGQKVPEPPDPQTKLPGMEDVSEPAAAGDEWWNMAVGNLGVANGLLSILYKSDIKTLGDLSTKMQIGEQWWRDVPGLGPVKAIEVSDAFAKFWNEHPEFCESAPEPADDGPVVTCPSCGYNAPPDEDGDCSQCHEPGIATPEKET